MSREQMEAVAAELGRLGVQASALERAPDWWVVLIRTPQAGLWAFYPYSAIGEWCGAQVDERGAFLNSRRLPTGITCDFEDRARIAQAIDFNLREFLGK